MSDFPHSSTEHSEKIAIVQSLLNAMTGETATDETVILSSTHDRGSDYGADVAINIPSLVLEGRSLEALAVCHAALRAADRQSPIGTLKPMIAELRKVLERELLSPLDVDVVSPTRRMHLLPRRSVLIGRPSADRSVDVQVNCRWFSRGDRNLLLFCEGSGWFVEDLGSTNGHSIGGSPLRLGHPVSLPVGDTCIDVGAAKNKAALATLHLHRPAKDPGAVVVTVSGTNTSQTEPNPWPTMIGDMARRWIIFREQIGVSVEEDCALSLDDGPTGVLAAIRYQSGFWIVPSSTGTLQVDEISFRESVPMPAGSALSLSGAKLRIELPKNFGAAELAKEHALAS